MKRETVKQLDIERYMGTWYEIARYPHSFERDLVGVTAHYELLNNGKIKVTNAGYYHSLQGKYTQATAKAKQPNPNKPGKLKVYFIPFFGASYWILDLDEDYQWAIVGSRSTNYLWILSRTPQMDNALYDELLDKVLKMGYKKEKILKIEQAKNTD